MAMSSAMAIQLTMTMTLETGIEPHKAAMLNLAMMFDMAKAPTVEVGIALF